MNRPCVGPIILVGEGDFSLSISLRGTKELKDTKITATSLLNDSEINLHKCAKENIRKLQTDGVEVLLGVDATRLSLVPALQDRHFQRIIFNFPHIGGKSNIKKNRHLLKEFFISACMFLEPDGEVHLTLARGQGGTPVDQPQRNWHDSWQVVAMAAYADLILIETVPFRREDFPQYGSTGYRSQDRQFNIHGAITHIFAQAKPIEVLGPTDSLMMEVTIGDTNYAAGRYISSKLNRCLLKDEHHPLGYVKRCLEERISCGLIGDVKFLSSSLLPLIIPELQKDTFNPHSYKVYCQYDQDGRGTNEKKRCLVNSLPAATPTEKPVVMLDPDQIQGHGAVQQARPHVGAKFHTLRTTMLQNVVSMVEKGDFEHNFSMYVASGNVFHRGPIHVNTLPVQHELVAFTWQIDQAELTTLAQGIIKATLSRQIDVFEGGEMNKECIQPWVREYMNVKQVIKVHPEKLSGCFEQAEGATAEQSSKSNLLFTQSQFCPTEPLGFVGKLKKDQQCNLLLLNLDLLSQVSFNLSEARMLWTENPLLLAQFKDMINGEGHSDKHHMGSLYPPLWTHDISFWLNGDRVFDEMEYFDIVRNFAGDCIKEVILMNTWTPPGTLDVSKCYRGIYQSCDQALSHFKAHEVQKNLRLKVAAELGVQLR